MSLTHRLALVLSLLPAALPLACSTSPQQEAGASGGAQAGSTGTATGTDHAVTTGDAGTVASQSTVTAAPSGACDGQTTTLPATITGNQTVSGNVLVPQPVTVAPGASLTVSGCASFSLADGAALNVAGTLKVTGQANQPVAFKPQNTSGTWGGIAVQQGGTASLTNIYLTSGAQTGFDCQTGAAGCTLANATITATPMPVHIAAAATISGSLFTDMQDKGMRFDPGANATVTDSTMYGPNGFDVIGVNGGTVQMQHVQIGGTDVQHCGIHINHADHFEIHASEIASNSYALMLGNTTSAQSTVIISGNNIRMSPQSHLSYIGGQFADLDLSGNYWDGPGYPEATASQIANVNGSGVLSQPVAGAGPQSGATSLNLLGDSGADKLPRRQPHPGVACYD